MGGEQRRDGGIAPGPVGDQIGNVLAREGVMDASAGECCLVVDEAGDAPGSGGIDEDGAVLRAQAREPGFLIGLGRESG